MFQLTKEEFEELKNNLMFQNGISRWGGTRKLPYAFSMALAELQAKEPRPKQRRRIGFIQDDDTQ